MAYFARGEYQHQAEVLAPPLQLRNVPLQGLTGLQRHPNYAENTANKGAQITAAAVHRAGFDRAQKHQPGKEGTGLEQA